jgi:hypothetical protein
MLILKLRYRSGASILGICLLQLSSLSEAVTPPPVQIRGSWSCAEWIQGRTMPESLDNTLSYSKQWLVGYLSGVAAGLDKDLLTGMNNDSIFLWMDNYCRANPLRRIDEGGYTLALEIIRTKKL